MDSLLLLWKSLNASNASFIFSIIYVSSEQNSSSATLFNSSGMRTMSSLLYYIIIKYSLDKAFAIESRADSNISNKYCLHNI